jgi:hypothetical protein
MEETERSILDLIQSASDPTAALEVALKLALTLLELTPTVQCTASSSRPA